MATSTTLERAARDLQDVYDRLRTAAERGGLSGVDARALELKMQGALSVVCLAAKIETGPCTPQQRRRYGVNRSDGEHKTEVSL